MFYIYNQCFNLKQDVKMILKEEPEKTSTTIGWNND